jgi:hypothetical protein
VIDREEFYKDVMTDIIRRYYEWDDPKKTRDEQSFNSINFVLGGPGKLSVE